MALNNKEKDIKRTLDERSISPSMEARERLSRLLHNEKPKKKRTAWLNWGIAASLLLGFVLGGMTFFNQSVPEEVPQQQVTFKRLDSQSKENKMLKEQLVQENIALEVTTNEKKTPIAETENNSKKISPKVSKLITVTKQSIAKTKLAISEPDTFEEKDFVEVEEILKNTPENLIKTSVNTYITPEALLATINGDSNPKINTSIKVIPNRYVDPKGLLTRIESQMFFDKNKSTLDKIRKQYKKVKEAVADINHE